MDKLIITKKTSFEEIRRTIGKLREQKGKEKETLKLIDEALSFGNGFVINLLFEQALTYQHLYMNDSSDRKALSDMEKTILKAGFYVNKYDVTEYSSRLFRFMGRVADYKKDYKKAVLNYRKAVKYAQRDPEKFRILELEAFLSFSLIMSGEFGKGYKLAKATYNKFINSDNGKLLKKNDYDTWAIWISGITIRTIAALIDKGLNFKLTEVEKWIKDTEKYLDVKDKFSYRKAEMKDLWTKIKNSKNL